MLGSGFAPLTKRIMTKQVKMLNNLYGAVCDNQYLLTAMPGMARRIPARRNLSDDKPEWENTSDNLTTYGDDVQGGLCEECRGPMHLPPARPRGRQRRRRKKARNRPPRTHIPVHQQENKVSDILDTWRDPLTTKVQLGNPPDEQDDENFKGHNLSLL